MKTLGRVLLVLSCAGISNAYSWDNHGLNTRVALSVFSEVQALDSVKVETLEDFLQAVQAELPVWLEEEEQWARKNLAEYPARPDSLKFDQKNEANLLRDSFLKAIRVNPRMPLTLFLHTQPGVSLGDKPALDRAQATLLPRSLKSGENFVELKPGEKVSAVDVIVTASDEPDYGLDIGLWEDNGTEFGQAYGFGKQPFGNPVLEFASQAPFHMGFFHEAKILYFAASVIKKTYPEFRIHLFSTLSRHAFHKGHPYWGLRFAGWGMHYIQDLTQPYHSTVFPGVSVSRMLWLNFLDIALGKSQPKTDQIQLVSNQHLALENYAYHIVLRELNGEKDYGVLRSLKANEKDSRSFSIADVRTQVTRKSNSEATRASQTLAQSLPPRLVLDPKYLFGVTEPDIDTLKEGEAFSLEAQKPLRDLIVELMADFGRFSRDFFYSVLH